MATKVSDRIALFLKEKGIKHVFGIIGAGNAHIFDSIGKLGFTEIISVHHEQAAIMAMGTYYRTCGIVSASIVTTGAGSTNAVTGVVSTWMDSIPGIIISGNEKSTFTREENNLRIWGVQGYDSSKMVEKVTKYSTRVHNASETIYEIEKAFHISSTGRPGPCWVDVPMDVQAVQLEDSNCRRYSPSNEGTIKITSKTNEEIDHLLSLMKSAKRPVFWFGHGIRLAGADHYLTKLLDLTKIPSLVTWQGIDMLDSHHPYVFGRAGVYGLRAANFVAQNCDLLICIGTRMAIPQIGYEISELAREAKVVCVDIDPLELEKYKKRLTLPILCDAKIFLETLLSSLKNEKLPIYGEWVEKCQEYRKRYPNIGPEHADTKGFINSYKFLDKLSDDLRPDEHIVTDMGTALLSGHQVLRLRPGQRLMTSTGLGEMGFGLPGAIGVSFARNKGEVLCLNCDGGIMMNLQELQTIAHHELPIKTIIFNNDGYLMIKHTQKNLFKGRYTCTDKKSGVTCPDFSKVGSAFGFPCYQIRTWQDYDKFAKKFLEEKGPAFCEVFMDPEQYFYPKLGLSLQKDGTIISPPLEDLSPFLSREEMRQNMLIGMHPKSEKINS